MIVYANNLVTMRTYISTVYATSIAVNYFLAYDGEKKKYRNNETFSIKIILNISQRTSEKLINLETQY